GPLNVVALVSGGKDSFYSILHCLANGHRIVALANLYPQPKQQYGSPSPPNANDGGDEEDETDLNSFMYQTVGHQVIPLYAQATGLPLFRQPILGTAVDHSKSYQDPDGQSLQADETESLVPLLRAVLATHPEINALCTGAILSTYQRTRVESVALRLGLVPLSYLWQFPELPISPAPETGISDDTQLLRDMADAGLEARIVKVASAGLDEDFLWENVAASVPRIRRVLRRFGGDGGRGAVLGEGGEFETLVVDGPSILFKGRILVAADDMKIVREGGGSAWLSIRKAQVEMKSAKDISSPALNDLQVRVPGLLDSRFENVLESLQDAAVLGYEYATPSKIPLPLLAAHLKLDSFSSPCWGFIGRSTDAKGSLMGVVDQVQALVELIRGRLLVDQLPATAITNSFIIIRRMADFPLVNDVYKGLFREPNPPARVTISCGDITLPRGSDVSIFVSIRRGLEQEERRGLHVQSRSYWAPANIGPYSQAIAYPLLENGEQTNKGTGSTFPLAVSIAGQIPLIPASMILPSTQLYGENTLRFQITLALQHLWRIGTEMQVQWWSSAVVYLARLPSSEAAKSTAMLVGTAWKEAHLNSGSHADTAEDLDPWDQRNNPLYMTYGDSGNSATARPPLPDWEVLNGFDVDVHGEDHDAMQKLLPFVFSAEVEELPRSAMVEWHAHLGFANISSGSI
ncbi:hypothetical protein M426DRAFT_46711, partial [Hypoxylon sp. CI-4A]